MHYARRLWLVLASLPACTGDGEAATADTGSGETTAADTSAGSTSSPMTDATATMATAVSDSADATSSSGGITHGDTDETSGVDTSGSTETTGGGACLDEFPAIVTDIDATLTTADSEFLLQLADGNYDPAEREGAAELINAYADLGYRVLYLTGRAEPLMSINTGESAHELTDRWLLEHGFPNDPETTLVILSPNIILPGAATQDYKTQALMDEQTAGWRFDYAYGNADTDIGAYAAAGIALDHTFIIGPQAGMGGTVAIDGEGWVEHTAAFLPTVPAVCEG